VFLTGSITLALYPFSHLGETAGHSFFLPPLDRKDRVIPFPEMRTKVPLAHEGDSSSPSSNYGQEGANDFAFPLTPSPFPF